MDRQVPILKRAIAEGVTITANLWEQYISKVMPTNAEELALLANAWDKIDYQSPWIFVFTKLGDLCQRRKVITETKTMTLLAWKHAGGESEGFKKLPKELVRLIVEFIGEQPFIRTFAKILGKACQIFNYGNDCRKIKANWLKKNIWAVEFFAKDFAFPIHTMFRIVEEVTCWDYSMFRKLKTPMTELVLRTGVCENKFLFFLFKYETDYATLEKLWIRVAKNIMRISGRIPPQRLVLETFKTKNRTSLQFLIVNDAFAVPSIEEFNNAPYGIKPKHNISYQGALDLIADVKSKIKKN